MTFTRDKTKKCTVVEGGDVEYNGERYSMSKLALKLMNELGYNWKYASGPAFFEYDGCVLSDIQSRYENS